MSEWQPIETAPREPFNSYGEGPKILMASIHGNGNICIAHWKTGRVRDWRILGTSMRPNATHWMPLPEPPKVEGS